MLVCMISYSFTPPVDRTQIVTVPVQTAPQRQSANAKAWENAPVRRYALALALASLVTSA